MLRKLETEVADILRADSRAVAERLRRRFDEVAGPANCLVLFGAGALGRRTLGELRRMGVEPAAFADNQPALWNHEVDGLKVHAPREAVRAFGDVAVFVVTIFNGSVVRQQLHDMGAQRVAPFTYLYWKYADHFLPFGSIDVPERLQEQNAAVLKCLSLWSDNASREAYVAQLRWRTTLDTMTLPPPLPAHDTYFPDDLIRPMTDEVLVDCGAFNGDTIRAFLERRGGSFEEIVALEPDPTNVAQLRRYVRSLSPAFRDKIVVCPVAAAAARGKRSFQATGTMASTIAPQGRSDVDGSPLDDVLAGRLPTYIKMDIEGSEHEALQGARRTIQKHEPVLAVCVYHRQDDLWRIPLLMRSINEHYRLFLRAYAEDCWELVCYAVPPGRLASTVS